MVQEIEIAAEMVQETEIAADRMKTKVRTAPTPGEAAEEAMVAMDQAPALASALSLEMELATVQEAPTPSHRRFNRFWNGDPFRLSGASAVELMRNPRAPLAWIHSLVTFGMEEEEQITKQASLEPLRW